MKTSEITIGRWLVRIVPVGAENWNGHRNISTAAMVEILDTENAHPTFSPRGQFVSSYYASTLLEHRDGAGIDLHGGVPAWTMNAGDVSQMLAFIRETLRPDRGSDMREALTRRRTA